MSDDTTEVEATESETDQSTESTDNTTDLAAEVEKWKALARKNEQRAKDNADKAKRLDDIEDANKSELQKLQDQLAAAQKVAADAETARLRASIANKHGVPEGLLTGSTEEALEESATALLAFKGKPPAAPSSDGQGKQGDAVSGQVKQLTREDLKSMTPEQIVAAQDAGQLNEMQGIR